MKYVTFESVLEEYDYQIEDKCFEMDLLSYKASFDSYIKSHYQAIRKQNRSKFVEAVQERKIHSTLKRRNLNSRQKILHGNGKEQVQG
jgi:hypothetical protein